jgi:hypothetical protein
MNRDFAEMLSALCAERVEFLIVGAFALAAHGLPRATGDIDIWVRPTPENAERTLRALSSFGAPLFDLSRDDLVRNDTVFQIGLPPARIDLMTGISGVDFEQAWRGRLDVELGDMRVAVLGLLELEKNKAAVDRPKDRADLVWIRERLGERAK